MIGRREFGILGISAAAAAVFQRGGFADDAAHEDDSAHHEHASGGKFESCARACSDCQRECDSCAAHCAHMVGEGHKEHMATLRSCLDCADVCACAAQIVSRKGPFMNLICKACAEACDHCARLCEKFPDDKHMTRCGKECRKCEKACRDMLA